jgi:hypothetical protein
MRAKGQHCTCFVPLCRFLAATSLLGFALDFFRTSSHTADVMRLPLRTGDTSHSQSSHADITAREFQWEFGFGLLSHGLFVVLLVGPFPKEAPNMLYFLGAAPNNVPVGILRYFLQNILNLWTDAINTGLRWTHCTLLGWCRLFPFQFPIQTFNFSQIRLHSLS